MTEFRVRAYINESKANDFRTQLETIAGPIIQVDEVVTAESHDKAALAIAITAATMVVSVIEENGANSQSELYPVRKGTVVT